MEDSFASITSVDNKVSRSPSCSRDLAFAQEKKNLRSSDSIIRVRCNHESIRGTQLFDRRAKNNQDKF